MTPPMTPREKVVFKQPCKHCQRMTTVDLTALASGSGDHADHSGEATDMVDHDGLEVLAWAFKLASDDTWDVCLTDPRCDTSDFSAVEPLVTAASAEALLAENAALRAANDVLEVERIGLRSAIFGSHDYDPALRHGNFIEMARTTEDARKGALNRATEAERKLAEAVGLLRRIGFTPDGKDGLSLSEIVIAARAFISKEAERG